MPEINPGLATARTNKQIYSLTVSVYCTVVSEPEEIYLSHSTAFLKWVKLALLFSFLTKSTLREKDLIIVSYNWVQLHHAQIVSFTVFFYYVDILKLFLFKSFTLV